MSRPLLSSRFIRSLLSESRNCQTLGKLQRFWQTPHFSTTAKMSSIGGASIGVGLYAAVSNPAQIAAKPEEADEKRHHLKNGKGFTNPWDSYVESSPWELLIKGMLW
jgi:hypothetical protein